MIKKQFIFSIFVLLAAGTFAQKTYTIKVKVKGLTDSLAYLGTYTGKNLFFYDTAVIEPDGSFVFTNTDMPHGVYSVIPSLKPPKYFDILVNEQEIEMETNLSDLVANLKIKKSKENIEFYKYVNFLQKNTIKKKPLLEQRNAAKDSNDSDLVTKLGAKIIEIDRSVQEYQKKLAKDKSDMLVGKLIKMSVEVEIPEAPENTEDANKYKMNY
ncbi:MAG: DUF4369 domain-containing protein, partial [Flavobacteriales bacterium]